VILPNLRSRVLVFQLLGCWFFEVQLSFESNERGVVCLDVKVSFEQVEKTNQNEEQQKRNKQAKQTTKHKDQGQEQTQNKQRKG